MAGHRPGHAMPTQHELGMQLGDTKNTMSGRDVSSGTDALSTPKNPWSLRVKGLPGQDPVVESTMELNGLAEMIATSKEGWSVWRNVQIKERKMPDFMPLAAICDLSQSDRRVFHEHDRRAAGYTEAEVAAFKIPSIQEL
eukprot:SAG11_NODE_18332_length_494_cov_0.731646_1_plen_139_part_10